MQVGIISDIHGDYDALDQALYRLQNLHQVDMILCAGDLAGRGPRQDTVVERVRAEGLITVRGNHDEYATQLTAENTAYLADLPLHWEAEIAGVRLFMCHGKPGNNMWGMYRDHLNRTYLDMVLTSLGADVLITGHTHLPLRMRSARGLVVNPGSLYYSFESSRSSSHSYGILHLPAARFDLYDLTQAELIPLPVTA
jgi:putative phosphoesterase